MLGRRVGWVESGVSAGWRMGWVVSAGWRVEWVARWVTVESAVTKLHFALGTLKCPVSSVPPLCPMTPPTEGAGTLGGPEAEGRGPLASILPRSTVQSASS